MITINKKDLNIRILRKLLNSVARKYDCGVSFHVNGSHLNYEGDAACAREIYSETLGIFHPSHGRQGARMAA
jgi:hypothetical protein